MRYTDEVLEFIMNKKEAYGEPLSAIAKELSLSRWTVGSLYNYTRSLRDGTLTVIRGSSFALADQITLQDCLSGVVKKKLALAHKSIQAVPEEAKFPSHW